MVSGCEFIKIYGTDCLTSIEKCNFETNTEYWQGGIEISHSILIPGSLIVVYNGQPHKGAICVGKSNYVKKVVCKIRVI